MRLGEPGDLKRRAAARGAHARFRAKHKFSRGNGQHYGCALDRIRRHGVQALKLHDCRIDHDAAVFRPDHRVPLDTAAVSQRKTVSAVVAYPLDLTSLTMLHPCADCGYFAAQPQVIERTSQLLTGRDGLAKERLEFAADGDHRIQRQPSKWAIVQPASSVLRKQQVSGRPWKFVLRRGRPLRMLAGKFPYVEVPWLEQVRDLVGRPYTVLAQNRAKYVGKLDARLKVQQLGMLLGPSSEVFDLRTEQADDLVFIVLPDLDGSKVAAQQGNKVALQPQPRSVSFHGHCVPGQDQRAIVRARVDCGPQPSFGVPGQPVDNQGNLPVPIEGMLDDFLDDGVD